VLAPQLFTVYHLPFTLFSLCAMRYALCDLTGPTDQVFNVE
jgi:hypothetical protein